MLIFAERDDFPASKSDEELVLLARRGDESCINELLKRAEGIIKKSVSLYIDKSFERDDMEQEAKIAFLNAVRTYDSKKGSSFKTYSAVCINNRLLSFIKSKNSKKMLSRSGFANIDEEGSASLPQEDNPENLFISREQYILLGELIRDVLSPLEYDVFRRLIEGMSYEKIAQELDISAKSVDNAVQRLRKKLRSILL